jgi:hypothetical protein
MEPTVARALNTRVLVRFVFRTVLLSAFATLSTRAFGTVLTTLLGLSAIFRAFVGVFRREAIFGPTLTHWDEAVAFAVMAHAVAALS